MAYRNVSVDTAMKMDIPKHSEAGTLGELLRAMSESASGARDAIEAIAESEPAIVIHCFAGRDRTGFIVALVLAAVRVIDEEIVRDHCLSDVELEAEYVKFRRERPDEAERHAYVVANRDRGVFALLRTIRELYGDAPNYLRALGVSDGSIETLRGLLVHSCR